MQNQDDNSKIPKRPRPPRPVKLTPGWGDGGKSLGANKGKLVNTTVVEDQDSVEAVVSAITNRITTQHPELLRKYGQDKVEAAIKSVAEFAGADGLEEIGSSDVSGWVKQVIVDLVFADGIKRLMPSQRVTEDQGSFVVVDNNKRIIYRGTRTEALKTARKRGLNFKNHVYSLSYWQDYFAQPWSSRSRMDENSSGVVTQTSVNYNQTKEIDNASVTVSANAKDIEQLQYMLKLAGLPVDHLLSVPPANPSVTDVVASTVEPTVSCWCDSKPAYDYIKDVKYSTDKETLLNYLKDKLNKSIS